MQPKPQVSEFTRGFAAFDPNPQALHLIIPAVLKLQPSNQTLTNPLPYNSLALSGARHGRAATALASPSQNQSGLL